MASQTKAVTELGKGDIFRDNRGRALEVITNDPGQYGTHRLTVTVLSSEVVVLDYTTTVRMIKEGTRAQTPS